ncbi:MAG: NfeD family protein [Oscillospiraceae bacterium]|nr:NfeD family protein [Oscillospiraceae bacterium]
MVIVWSAAAVVFLIIEAATAGLASVWFAAGAIGALISALFSAPVWLQTVWFILISGVTLWFTRPLARKYVNSRRQPTNADRVIGTEAYVTETIDNIKGSGTVSVSGKIWTARSVSGEIIEKGSRVTAKEISGVKLMVIPIPPEAEEPVETYKAETYKQEEE